MAIQPREVVDALNEREQADKVLDRWGSLRVRYDEWHDELETIYKLYAGEWDVVWPDAVRSKALPKVMNYIQIASDDRARSVSGMRPSMVYRPQKPGDKPRAAADKVERIVNGWWEKNYVQLATERWAHDSIAGGLTVCNTFPFRQFALPKAERFAAFERIEPALCYPDPIFSNGPFVESMVVTAERKVRDVENQFGVRLFSGMQNRNAMGDVVRLIWFYDDTEVCVVAEATDAPYTEKPSEVVFQVKHKMGKCPVVIGTRKTMDGRYRGEFYGSLGVINFLNRLMTLVLDDAISKVYPSKLSWEIENPEEYGPDALLEATSERARFEFVQPPTQTFTNMQLLRDLQGAARAGVLLPPSRSGDPNESIISAAGISASQSQRTEDVANIQQQIIAPMMEAAFQMASQFERQWADVEKTINLTSYSRGAGAEIYTPSKDLPEHCNVKVVYGPVAGLDPINTNVMVLQQHGSGLISKRTAMEQSPFVEDPQREEKQQVLEQLDAATLAGLYAKAQQGLVPAETVAAIRKAVESDETSLHDAIMANLNAAPMAPPEPSPGGMGGNPASPGIAGAGEAQQPQEPQLPDLASLMGGAGG